MKKLIAVIICLSFVSACAGGFHSGAAQVKITPPIGVPMSGYYYERAATGVHDDLYAHALVFSKDETTIALVTCDLIGMDDHMVTQIRQAIEQSTDIPGQNVMISCTHTHTGPTIPRGTKRDKPKSEAGKILAQYLEDLPDRIALAVQQAQEKLQPAQLTAAVGHEDSISFNRRFFMTDGTVGWNPGKRNPKIIKPAGPIDPAVSFVYVETEAGAPISTYVNFANHLDTVGGLDFSADYPYTLYSLLGKVKGLDMVTLFAQGCSGNINHLDVTTAERQKGHAEAARIGMVLTGEVLKTYTRLKSINPTSIGIRRKVVQLPLPQVSPDEVARARKTAATYDTPEAAPFMELVNAFKVIGVYERQGEPLEAEVQVMALGQDLAWVALPGEIFVEIGLAIKEASPYDVTIVTELANGSIGYVPDRKAYDEGNYEPVSARCAAGSGERLVKASLQMLHELKGL
jgi:neutral/alkaline ceramidase-like enzyme